MTAQAKAPSIVKILLPIVVILIAVVIALNFIKSNVGDSHSEYAIEEGTMLPDFVLNEFGGGSYLFSKIDAKVVLLNFWATWCEACLIEMPSLIRLRNKFKDQGFHLAFINLDENPESVVPEMLKRMKINFANYVDRDQKLSDLFDVHGIPLSVALTKDRKILFAYAGELDWDEKKVHQRVEAWLGDQAKR